MKVAGYWRLKQTLYRMDGITANTEAMEQTRQPDATKREAERSMAPTQERRERTKVHAA